MDYISLTEGITLLFCSQMVALIHLQPPPPTPTPPAGPLPTDTNHEIAGIENSIPQISNAKIACGISYKIIHSYMTGLLIL